LLGLIGLANLFRKPEEDTVTPR